MATENPHFQLGNTSSKGPFFHCNMLKGIFFFGCVCVTDCVCRLPNDDLYHLDFFEQGNFDQYQPFKQ